MDYLDMRPPASFPGLAVSDAGMPFDRMADQMAVEAMAQSYTGFATQAHESHPSFDRLVLLVFEAVMEVVCVCLPGYIIARLGHFDADKQKFLANLNVMLFTPCLIFTKLASQLNPSKLAELGVIPVIFLFQLLVSYLVSTVVARCFRLNRRASNFVTAMGVFGNSNSLPISLVISLSQTLKGLHWNKIPGDNDDDVAARGILYLLIFQQLGQLVRWSWGYHVLLAPKHKYEEYRDELVEEGRPLIEDHDDSVRDSDRLSRHIEASEVLFKSEGRHHHRTGTNSDDSARYEPAGRTPVPSTSGATPNDSEDEDEEEEGHKKLDAKPRKAAGLSAKTCPADELGDALDGIHSFPPIDGSDEPGLDRGFKGFTVRTRRFARRNSTRAAGRVAARVCQGYAALPRPLQRTLGALHWASRRIYAFIWEFMNPPLWAMLIALVVASNPSLQSLFFREGSFVKSSVTTAVSQSAGVAVPLILVVLGANLARNTQSHETADPEEKEIGTRLLVASLISRMLLPTLIMAPLLAVFAKYVPISILDDPIFIIVCFLLSGAPSALQLAQICQINGVYENRMSQILFQGYVVWILPSTLVLVVCALEVVEWAK